MMNRLVCLALAGIAAVMLAACGGQKDNAAPSAPQTTEAEKKALSLNEIYNEIEKKVELCSPMIMPDDFVTNYYGIDLGKLDEYVFSMSEEAISAEMVLMMKAKDQADIPVLKEGLQMVIDQKKSEMDNYLPEQYDIVAKSRIISKYNYLYAVSSEHADDILAIIEDGIQ